MRPRIAYTTYTTVLYDHYDTWKQMPISVCCRCRAIPRTRLCLFCTTFVHRAASNTLVREEGVFVFVRCCLSSRVSSPFFFLAFFFWLLFNINSYSSTAEQQYSKPCVLCFASRSPLALFALFALSASIPCRRVCLYFCVERVRTHTPQGLLSIVDSFSCRPSRISCLAWLCLVIICQTMTRPSS